jgi:hypothetical protein
MAHPGEDPAMLRFSWAAAPSARATIYASKDLFDRLFFFLLFKFEFSVTKMPV